MDYCAMLRSRQSDKKKDVVLDNALVANDEAWKNFYELYSRCLLDIASRYTKDGILRQVQEDENDLVNGFLMKFINSDQQKQPAALSDGRPLKPWLIKSIRNYIFDRIDHHKAQIRYPGPGMLCSLDKLLGTEDGKPLTLADILPAREPIAQEEPIKLRIRLQSYGKSIVSLRGIVMRPSLFAQQKPGKSQNN